MSSVIIDVREPFEYDMGHVEGAINLPPAELVQNSDKLKSIPKDAEIILYCKTGSRSAVSANYLKNLGYTNLTNGINQMHVEAKLKR